MVFPFFMEPDVLPDDFCGHLIPHRTNEISVFPKFSTPQLLVHAWEILPNDLGAHRFKHLNHPGNGILWREGEKEMYMVFFNLHLGNFKSRSEEHTSELQSREKLVCRLLHEK